MAHISSRRLLWWRIALPPVLHLFCDISGYFIYPEIVTSHYAGPLWFWSYLEEFVVITMGLYCVSEGNVRAYTWFEERIPWEKHPGKRLAVQLLFALAWTVVAAGIVTFLLVIFGQEVLSRDLTINMLLMSLIVTVGVVIIFFFQKMKASWVEAEHLRGETAAAQEHALRQQTDPHFLFNSLNTLTSLIAEDPALATQYVGRLSKVYRYVLQSKDHTLVTLGEELEFVRDFAFGFSLRFGESFRLNVEVPPRYLETFIPPLTLQILVENCVKHNIVSKHKPLSVHIGTENNGRLVVSNHVQHKTAENSPTRMGLKNII